MTKGLQHAEKAIRNLNAAIVAGDGDAPVSLVDELRDRERVQKALLAELTSLTEAPTLTPEVVSKIRDDAMALLKGWRELLLTRQVPVSRSLLRKLLDQSRFVFYPKADDRERWYELGVTPSLQKFFEAVPAFSKTMASPTGRDPFLYRGFVGRRAA